MFDYTGSFHYLWIDLIINIILILIILLFNKRFEKLKFKHIVILFLITRLVYFIFRIATHNISLDNDTTWYYNYGKLFLGGEYPSMEYPQGALFIFSIFSYFAPNLESFRLLFPLFQIPFGLIIIYSINWFGKTLKNTRISNTGIIIYVLSPSIMWFWFNRFDEIAISLLLLSMVFFSANKKNIGTVINFISFSIKWFPIVILPNYGLYWLKQKKYKTILKTAAIYIILGCILFLPFFIFSKEKFIHTYETHLPRTILGESSYYSLESAITGEKIAPYESPNPPKIFTNNVTLIITIIIFLSWFFYVWKTVKKERLIIYSCFTVFLFVITNKVYSTQYIVWLMPLLIILAMYLKLTEKEIKIYFVALVLLQLLNFLKSPVPIENWVIFARLFWALFLSIVVFSLIRIHKSKETGTH